MNKYSFKVKIDCAECALEVEEALKKNKNVKSASFNFPKGKLSVTTTLSELDIMKICKEYEDDISFLDYEKNDNKRDLRIIRIILSLIILALSFIFKKIEWISIFAYIISGYDVIYKAVKNMIKGKVFDENFLMSIATISALIIKYFTEAAAVMVFYQIGEFFQDKATEKSKKNISLTLDLSVDKVTIKKDDVWCEIKSEEANIGDEILVKGGEKIPLDGVVLSGESFINTSALNGEGTPVKVERGDKVLSGSVNGNNTLIIKAEKKYKDSTSMKIMRLSEEMEGKKSKSEKFISTFSRYYTPIVCITALLLFLIPPLFNLLEWKDSLYRAAELLVISCPCALVLSIPLTYFSSLGAFSKKGIIVKGDEAVERLSKITTVALDKTGTLTEGVFNVQNVYLYSSDEEEMVTLSSALERESTHPVASAITTYDKYNLNLKAENVENIPGVGIKGIINGDDVKVGNSKIAPNLPELDSDGTLIYVIKNDTLLGVFEINDKIREDASSTISKLREENVKKIVMLSGDRNVRVKHTSEYLHLDSYYGELTPEEKINKVEELESEEGTLCYIGDGINDTPSLKRADVGVAMGGKGSDSALSSSDVILLNDKISSLPIAIKIAKKTEKLCKENIVLSLVIKFVVFVLSILGISNMALAVFADTGVCLLATLNATRAYRYKEGE